MYKKTAGDQLRNVYPHCLCILNPQDNLPCRINCRAIANGKVPRPKDVERPLKIEHFSKVSWGSDTQYLSVKTTSKVSNNHAKILTYRYSVLASKGFFKKARKLKFAIFEPFGCIVHEALN